MSRPSRTVLELAQWPVELIELPTDHSGIVGRVDDATRQLFSRDGRAPPSPWSTEVADRIVAPTHFFVVKPTVVKSGCSNVAAP